MCGFVVVISPRRRTRLADLMRMNRALRHRGPDDEGYLVTDGAEPAVRFWGPDTPEPVQSADTPSRPQSAAADHADRTGALMMAHRRLAIVDLSPWGHQPMVRGDALEIVYNGEIYNHVELRVELESLGHRFVSHSDTEVLLAAYAQWGSEALARCNGMWALALHDRRRGVVFVARDRFGVKPLFVWRGQGELLLASEIKALLAHPHVATRAHAARCADFVVQGAQAWHRQTLFDGIEVFPAGHWAEIALDAPDLRPRRWWRRPERSPEFARQPFDRATAYRLVARYRELLDDAVRVRMRMDVRFGTALSGGLDSSQIASRVNVELRRRGASERQAVFSSVYAGSARSEALHPAFEQALRRADESLHIEKVARHLGVDAFSIEPRWQDVPAAHEKMLWALDQPPDNTLMSSWHTYALVASHGVTVTLDGQGADEQLAGYLKYLRNLLIHGRTRDLLAVRAIAHHARGSLRNALVGAAGHLVRRLLGRAALDSLARSVERAHGFELDLPQALAFDFDHGLQTLLHYADHSAMAWSIESRMPFMDWRLVEFLCGVPPAYLVHDGWTKWLARQAMRDELPAGVVWRRDKVGWAIPEDAWFGADGPLRPWLDGVVAGSAFAADTLARLPASARPAAARVRLLNLALWHRLYFEEPGRPGRTLGRAPA